MPEVTGAGGSTDAIRIDTPEYHHNPFPTYKLLREQYPVCRVEPGGIWMISRFEDVQFALKRHDLFSSAGVEVMIKPDWIREECKRDLFVLLKDPPEHTRYRAMINKAFVARVINALQPLMLDNAQLLLQQIAAGESVEFLGRFAYPYIGKVITRITGIDEEQDWEEMRVWLELVEKITPMRPDDDFIERVEAAILRQHSYFEAVIRDRRASPRDDLVTRLMEADVGGERLTDLEMRNALELMVGAGFHTTTHLLTHAMMQLARQPGLMPQLRAAPDLIPAFIDELLRFDAPVHLAPRRTVQDVCMHGVRIPKGEMVMVAMGAANRDPAAFPDPDNFDITRPNLRQHMGFGYGDHTCIGSALARMEARIALQTILARFERVSCAPDEELHWVETVTTHGVHSLPVTFQ